MVEGSELCSAGCVVHVGVHGEWVVLWVAALQLLLSMAEAVECTSSAESVWHVRVYVCCMLLNVADILYVGKLLVSNSEWLVCLLSVFE